MPNQAFVIGAKAMIGTAFAAIAYGISASPSRRQRASTSATTIAARAADHEAAERLLEREPAGAPERARARPRTSSRSPRARGSRNRSDVERARRRHSQAAIPSSEDETRRHPVADALHSPSSATISVSSTRSSSRRGRRAPERLAHLGDELEEARLLARLGACAAAAGRCRRCPAIRPGRARHHDDARREEDGLGDRVRDEDDRRAGLAPRSAAARMFSRSRVISSSAPNGSSISSSAGENESARAIETRCCIPPESCHGWWFSKPVSSTSSSISLDALARGAPAPSRASRAAARCSSPTVRQS